MALQRLYDAMTGWSLFDSPKAAPAVTVTLTPQIAPPVMFRVPLPTVPAPGPKVPVRAIPPPPRPTAPPKKAKAPKSGAKPVKAPKVPGAKAPKQRDPIPFEVRDRVWLQYHGAQTAGPCYCCGTIVEKYHKGWHCAHVLAVAKGGTETLENLRTSCGHCNLSMGDQNLYAYIRDHHMTGPGARNVDAYFRKYPSQMHDKRTNNWGK